MNNPQMNNTTITKFPTHFQELITKALSLGKYVPGPRLLQAMGERDFSFCQAILANEISQETARFRLAVCTGEAIARGLEITRSLLGRLSEELFGIEMHPRTIRKHKDIWFGIEMHTVQTWAIGINTLICKSEVRVVSFLNSSFLNEAAGNETKAFVERMKRKLESAQEDSEPLWVSIDKEQRSEACQTDISVEVKPNTGSTHPQQSPPFSRISARTCVSKSHSRKTGSISSRILSSAKKLIVKLASFKKPTVIGAASSSQQSISKEQSTSKKSLTKYKQSSELPDLEPEWVCEDPPLTEEELRRLGYEEPRLNLNALPRPLILRHAPQRGDKDDPAYNPNLFDRSFVKKREQPRLLYPKWSTL